MGVVTLIREWRKTCEGCGNLTWELWPRERKAFICTDCPFRCRRRVISVEPERAQEASVIRPAWCKKEKTGLRPGKL